jgi:hypothetical protein
MGSFVFLIILGLVAVGLMVGFQDLKKKEKQLKERTKQEELWSRERAINDELRIKREEERIRLEEQRIKERLDERDKAFQKLIEREGQRIKELLDEREQAFQKGFCHGRRWLADMIAEKESERDREAEIYLCTKRPPAFQAAQVVRQVKQEKRELCATLKFLEYQLRSYEEYFPFLEDYKEAILDERIPLSGEADNVAAIENTDPVQLFLDKAEYDKLPSADRNQRALERYLTKPKTNWEIGRLYERYLGYFYEMKGWRVTYEGAIKGFEDFGRDLICFKDNRIKIVQAKYWRQERVVREKHVFQLFGTACLYKRQHPNNPIEAVFCSTTELSEEALDVARRLKVNVRVIPFEKTYPMIKCNINSSTKEKIYHLPFDQQYDRAVIGNQPGEFYARTAQEAEENGFRRAWRYRGHQNLNIGTNPPIG